jgi:hypothetical protein
MTMSQTGTLTVIGTSTITSAGKTLGGLTVNTSAITVTLGDALSLTNNLTVTFGTFNTSASNYSVTADSLVSTGSSTRVITLNASSVTLTGATPINFAATGLTFNGGTSTINANAATLSIVTGAKTIPNLTIGSTALVSATLSNGAGSAVTLGSLTVAARAATGRGTLDIGSGVTVSGNFTATAGANATYRLKIIATSATSFSAATVSLTDVDFKNITGAGAATWSGTRLGNAGGNTNITFATAKTVYWNLAGTQSVSATGWATASGGTPAANNFPLAQDTMVLDNTGAIGTITLDGNWDFGTFSAGTRTSAATINFSTNQSFFGNWTNGTGLTITGSATLAFNGTAAQSITSNGVPFSNTITKDSKATTLTLQDNLTVGNLTLTPTLGTFSLNNFTATVTTTLTLSGAFSLAFGTGKFSLTGSGSIFTNNGYFGSVTGTNLVSVDYTGSSAVTVTATGSTVPNISFTAGNYALSLNGNVLDLNFTGYSGTFTSGGNTLKGNLTFGAGMTVSNTGSPTIEFNNTLASQNITTNGVSVGCSIQLVTTGNFPYPNLVLQDNLTQPAGAMFTLNAGTLSLNGKTLTNNSTFTVNNDDTSAINFGSSGKLTLQSSGTAFSNSSTVFSTAGTGIISLTSASSKTFAGGGLVYSGVTLQQAGAGALSITGANTFASISNTVQPTTITFPASTTTTVTTWGVNGTSGNLVTINSSTSGTRATLAGSDASAKSGSYMSIQDSNATVGTWTASASTNVSNNLGWTFGGGTYSVTITESASGLDAVTAARTVQVIITEASSGVDTSTPPGGNSSLSENASGLDSVIAVLIARAVIAEASSGLETAVPPKTGLITESASGLDAISAVLVVRAAIDEASSGASLTVQPLSATEVFESAVGADSVSVRVVLSGNVFEATSGADVDAGLAGSFIVESARGVDSVTAAFLWNLIDNAQTTTWVPINTTPNAT